MRERIVGRLRDGQLEVLIATDVVARGLDVPRISHVVNYDIPYDTESYVHRIGRTGRAGRSGEAILFVAPRERRMLKTIERATGQPIESMEMPSASAINETRVEKFKQRIIDALSQERDLSLFYQVVKQIEAEQRRHRPAADLRGTGLHAPGRYTAAARRQGAATTRRRTAP
jgi:ATP-dependent RNA helicase DeaD